MSSAWFSSLLRRGCRTSQRRGGTSRRLRPTRFLPSLEALEARWVPSTLDGGLGDGLGGLTDGMSDQGLGQQSSGAGAAAASTSIRLTVQNLNDSGPGSLRQALLDANGMAGAHTITFAGGLRGTINLLTA